ncbi:unnamed protein product [Prunus armeniaca]
MVEIQFHARIQVLHSRNGGEFLNHDLNQFLQDHGVIHQCSCLYTPQQNGVAERKNQHLLEVVRASLFDANMPRPFWGEAVLSASYLINRIPSSILNFQTPLQTLHQHIQMPLIPNLEPQIFGCVVFFHIHDHQQSKPRSVLSLAMHLIRKDIGVIILLVIRMPFCLKTTGSQWKVIGYPLSSSNKENLLQNDRSLVESYRSPPFSSSNMENLLQNGRSPKKNDKLSQRCQNQEEEIESFYEILPA